MRAARQVRKIGRSIDERGLRIDEDVPNDAHSTRSAAVTRIPAKVVFVPIFGKNQEWDPAFAE
jgi:hypothetical protein